MLACCRINAFVLQHEAGYRDVIHDVRLHDLGNILRLYSAVPHRLGIHDHRWSVLTLVEAPGLIGAHDALETAVGNSSLEELLQVAPSTLRAASAGASRLAYVGTNKDVLLKFGHVGIVSTESVVSCCKGGSLACGLMPKHMKTNSFSHSPAACVTAEKSRRSS